MTAFVILAAGPGTRMGRDFGWLHKALLPIDGRAVISHQIGLAPPGARLIVCTGYRAGQVRDYAELAHPGLPVTFVPVPGWDQPGGGPGASLLAARDAVGGEDLIFTSCDTLWLPDVTLWNAVTSWASVAPVPAGTAPERWCRISFTPQTGEAYAIHDKLPARYPGEAYAGLAMVQRHDLPAFWAGIENSRSPGEELQVTGGLAALIRQSALNGRQLVWTDVGDETAYARAVAARSGYDWAKPGQVTYVLPDTGRVVKLAADQDMLIRLAGRQAAIAGATPKLTGARPHMLACEYVPGVPAYDVAENDAGLVPRLLDWARSDLWRPARATDPAGACDRFYRTKTQARVAMLRPGLREKAERAIAGVNWAELAAGCEPVTFHGDFNIGNVIVTPDGGFTAIDWRDDFAGETTWGDRRYDLGKLTAGMIVHWGNARRGDFAPWPAGGEHLGALADWFGGAIPGDIMVIAALSLLNSAPLHAEPLGEILVARAAIMMERL